ncbi:hypothetical protein [Lentibacillus cibarius]|uniref:Uncharacterized protein n=1 Tax=Lentibacillus cibarius TaxID=2583219 RepID=A0A5S3QHG0_9BACI|nr:hypothetical protein [Lentibacillus cibarius]TMN18719.1 hypothetical protein FFL34_18035 [Lentibacillus cibarius]
MYTQTKIGNKITGFSCTGPLTNRLQGQQINKYPYCAKFMMKWREECLIILLWKIQRTGYGRTYIIRIKDIDRQVNETLTSKQANEFIQEEKELYGYLQDLLENDGQERDTSVYYNWLEED